MDCALESKTEILSMTYQARRNEGEIRLGNNAKQVARAACVVRRPLASAASLSCNCPTLVLFSANVVIEPSAVKDCQLPLPPVRARSLSEG